jgi:hypothetical protein
MLVQSRETCLHTRVICLGTILLALLASCTSNGDVPKAVQVVTSRASSPIVPDVAELSAFIPAGATLGLAVRGDIDADGDEDVLIVLQNSVGDEPQFKPRTLMVLRRHPDGHLEKKIENTKAILCRRCGSFVLDDSLEGIHINGTGFSLRFEGLSRVMWSREYHFEYSTHDRTWLLREIKGGVTDRIDGSSCVTRLGPKEFGPISLAQFDPEELPICSLP